VAARGWDQWALKGFSVGYQPASRITAVQWALAAAALLLVAGAVLVARRQELGADYRRWWMTARGSFLALSDRVQLVLATHDHADHFDAGAVWRHLDHNALSVFVSTPQAVARVRATPSTPDLEERTYATFPPEGQREKFAVEGIDLDVLNLHHGTDRDPPVENVAFLVDIEGFRVLHLGDTEASVEDLSAYELSADSIDVAFVPYWYLMDPSDRRIIDAAIKPGHIVAMHIPVENAAPSYFGSAGSLAALEARLRENYPGILILQEPFASTRIERP